MNESYGKKFILDGELHPSEHFDNSFVYGGDSIYEVIRMMRGIPVFFHDHMERLEGSLKLQGKARLAGKAEKRKEVNLKLVFNYNGDTTRYLIYFVEPVYPSDEQYRNGVKGVLVNAERQDPGSKVINHRLRSSIYHKLILEGGYEALLVNRDNEITEGSRSNIFFLKGNTLVTAPDNRILSGITRKYILDICREQGIKLEFYCLPVDSISACDAVFMTGTSPMVLQFHTVGDSHFRVPVPMIDKLRKLYIARAVESLRGFVTGE